MIKKIFVFTAMLLLATAASASDGSAWGNPEPVSGQGTFMDIGVGLRINHLEQINADPLLSLGFTRKFSRNGGWMAEVDFRNRTTMGNGAEIRTFGFNMGLTIEDHLGPMRPLVGAGISWKRYEGHQYSSTFEDTKLGLMLLAGFVLPLDENSAIQFGIKYIRNASGGSSPIVAPSAATPPIHEGYEFPYYYNTNYLYNPTELFVKYRFEL